LVVAVDDLIAFLCARLDEDEALAQAVIQAVGPERSGEPFTDGSGIAEVDSYPSYPYGQHAEELAFMAGPGHPARVLAEAEAKRRMVDECVSTLGDNDDGYWPAKQTLRLLALPYADHPDYREEWRP
jgi:hypothetical protein